MWVLYSHARALLQPYMLESSTPTLLISRAPPQHSSSQLVNAGNLATQRLPGSAMGLTGCVAAPGEWSMLHCDPGLFRSALLCFQVVPRRSSMLAFEGRAVLPRWDLLPGTDGAAYQRQKQILLCEVRLSLCFMVDQAVTWRMTHWSDLLCFFYKRLDFARCINSTCKYIAQMRDS